MVIKSTRKQTADPNFSLSDVKAECTGRGCHGDVLRAIECEIHFVHDKRLELEMF